MSRVAIVCRPHKEEIPRLLPELIGWLKQRGYEPIVDPVGGACTTGVQVAEHAEMPSHNPELVIVLGGDGTLLSIARIFAESGTPILGVNLGYLGFLTEIRLSDLYTTLDGWCGNCHSIDERSMLHVEVWRDGKLCSSHEGLNEAVISKADMARMGDFSVVLDGKPVAHFRADGVIVSTPTGSTAYTLAANGPILTPNVNAMVVTPICPHLLTLRPIVVPGDAVLTVAVEAMPTQALLIVDGQKPVDLEIGDEVRCGRSLLTVKLVRISDSGFFEALRSKLSWGEQ
ncbi:MAG: NAD(+)/NADH kinase [Acidobacteriota bacterium]|nr:NAD(+)/NADH kinase [Acidobacteriota bacterium]